MSGVCQEWTARQDDFSANTGHSPNAVSMLAHHLRRWPNIETALGECPVLLGIICTGGQNSTDMQNQKTVTAYLKI